MGVESYSYILVKSLYVLVTNRVQGSVFCTMLKQKQINKTKQNKKKQSKTDRRNSRNRATTKAKKRKKEQEK